MHNFSGEKAVDNVVCTVYSPFEADSVSIELLYGDEIIFTEAATLSPVETFTKTVNIKNADGKKLTLLVRKDETTLLHCTIGEADTEPIPSPTEALPAPKEIDTTEKLFLAATHLEQYFSSAIKSSVWKNPNLYDCEPYFNFGLAQKKQGHTDKAFDAFYKAVWDGNMQDKAFYQLACIAAGREAYEEALLYIEKSLVKGLHNLRARTLKSALLRLTGRLEEALDFVQDTIRIDALDSGARYELYAITRDNKHLQELKKIMRGDNHNYIELALCYRKAYLYEEAAAILKLAENDNEPMLHYYLYELTGDKKELNRAELANSLYCFPNRLEDIDVLQNATDHGGAYAAYYLGNLLYDRGRFEESIHLWESCADKIALPTVYRNLALAYYNKLHQPDKAKTAMETAFAMDMSDARVFFELDQLYKILNTSPAQRLEHMHLHKDLLEQRDDLYTEYITLLNLNGAYEEAYRRIMSHNFHPWEGGEGKIPAQYRIALMHMAESENDTAKAIELLQKALIYPHNLGG